MVRIPPMCEEVFKRYGCLTLDLILELEDERIDRSSIASLNYTTVRAYERLSASLCAQLFAYEHFNLSRPTIREVLWQKEVLKVLEAKFKGSEASPTDLLQG